MRFPALITLILLLAPPVFAQVTASDGPVALVGVNVIPMTGETVLPDQTVLIRNGRIDRIGPTDDTKVPRRATKIDARGKYLVPGLSDLHAHFYGGRDGNPDVTALYMARGVTSVLNMRGTRGVLELRELIEAGEIHGPTIYSASPILGNVSPTPSTYDKGVSMVEEFAEQGYDFIKVYNFIPKEGYEGIIATAKRLDIPVVGHAVRSVGLEGAIENGQHIAHMEEIIYGYFKDDLDESKIEPLARRIKEAGIGVVATLVAYKHIIQQVEDLDAMLHSEGIEYLPERMMSSWKPDKNGYVSGFTLEESENGLKPAFAFQQKLAKAFHDAGVPVLLGTDACIPIVIPGYSAHIELRNLVEAGLTPYQALEAGTIKAAEFLGHADEFGTIEEGKRADLILLDANPLEDIANSEKIAGVATRGIWYDKPTLDALLADILARKNAD